VARDEREVYEAADLRPSCRGHFFPPAGQHAL